MTSNSVKYSVIIPTLNGYKTLSKTLPKMLSIDRDDIQWVISDNYSDDDIFKYVSAFDDPRITLVRPEKRLQVGAHLDFAYRYATGQWQGHLGDDDMIFPSRFSILDRVINNYPDVDLVRGEFARYYWHDFPVREMANKLSPSKYYSASVSIFDGIQYFKKMLNSKRVYGGGSWVVKKNVVDKIRGKLGYFSPFHSVEFFCMRASALVSQKVAEVDLPIWIAGRHASSVGSQALMSEDKVKSTDWNWSFEDPGNHRYCPFQYKGYVPISLDAAMQVVEEFSGDFELGEIDKKYWAKMVLIETEHLIKEKKLYSSYRKERDELVVHEIGFLSLLLLSVLYRIYNKMPNFLSNMYIKLRTRSMVPSTHLFGWKDMASIEELYKKNDILGFSESLDEEILRRILKLRF